jgi:hypothetical protein
VRAMVLRIYLAADVNVSEKSIVSIFRVEAGDVSPKRLVFTDEYTKLKPRITIS